MRTSSPLLYKQKAWLLHAGMLITTSSLKLIQGLWLWWEGTKAPQFQNAATALRNVNEIADSVLSSSALFLWSVSQCWLQHHETICMKTLMHHEYSKTHSPHHTTSQPCILVLWCDKWRHTLPHHINTNQSPLLGERCGRVVYMHCRTSAPRASLM